MADHLPDDLDDTRLEAILYPGVNNVNARLVDVTPPDWQSVYTELKKKGVTLRLLWEEYSALQPKPCGYSWYCEQFGKWGTKRRISMRQIHKAGEKLFIDFASKTVPMTNQWSFTHLNIFLPPPRLKAFRKRLQSLMFLGHR